MLTWIAPGIRPVIAIGAALIGFALAVRSLLPGLRKRAAIGWIKMALFGAYAGLVLTTLVVSIFQLATVQAVRAMGMLVLGTGGIVLLLATRSSIGKQNRRGQVLVSAVAALGLVLNIIWFIFAYSKYPSIVLQRL